MAANPEFKIQSTTITEVRGGIAFETWEQLENALCTISPQEAQRNFDSLKPGTHKEYAEGSELSFPIHFSSSTLPGSSGRRLAMKIRRDPPEAYASNRLYVLDIIDLGDMAHFPQATEEAILAAQLGAEQGIYYKAVTVDLASQSDQFVLDFAQVADRSIKALSSDFSYAGYSPSSRRGQYSNELSPLDQLLDNIKADLQEPYSYHDANHRCLWLGVDQDRLGLAVSLGLRGIGSRYDKNMFWGKGMHRDLHDLSGLEDQWHWQGSVLTAPREHCWELGSETGQLEPMSLFIRVGRLRSSETIGLTQERAILPVTNPNMKTRIEQITNRLANSFKE